MYAIIQIEPNYHVSAKSSGPTGILESTDSAVIVRTSREN